MLRKISTVCIFMLGLLLWQSGLSHARQNIAERSRGEYEKRSEKQARSQEYGYRNTTPPDYRFLNPKSAGR